MKSSEVPFNASYFKQTNRKRPQVLNHIVATVVDSQSFKQTTCEEQA